MSESSTFSVGETVTLLKETDDRILEQSVRLDRRAEGEEFPFWAEEGDVVWIVIALDDGPLLKTDEEDYARVENLEKSDLFQ